MLETAPESENEWLVEALKYPPGNTLKERLEQVTEPIRSILADCIEDLDSFRSDVKNARDYLTHPGNVESEVYDYHNLWRQLRTVLEVCFLREIGIPEHLYSTIARRHPFRHD